MDRSAREGPGDIRLLDRLLGLVDDIGTEEGNRTGGNGKILGDEAKHAAHVLQPVHPEEIGNQYSALEQDPLLLGEA